MFGGLSAWQGVKGREKEMNKKFYQLRRQRELTQGELANRLHVKQQTVSNWESEKADPHISILPLLAEVLEVSEYEIYEMFVEKHRAKR